MALQPSRVRVLIVLSFLLALAGALPTPAAAASPADACAPTGSETVRTDKARYPTEDLVHVSGSGYAAGCEVVVRIVRPDGSVVVGDGSETTGSDVVRTSADGRLAYDYRLGTVSGTYRIYVVHPESGAVLASAEFEDAAILTNLRLGATGAENYVFAAGDRVDAAGTVSNSRNYRWTILRSDGTSTVGPCTATSSTTQGGSEAVTYSYTVAASDPASTATPYTFRLQEFANNDTTCTGATPSTADLQFTVARATSYSDAALTAPRAAFGAGQSAYLRVDGVTASQADWSVTWIPPSGSVACANTLGTDRPDSSAAGRLPDTAGSFLQYAPGASGAVWNLSANFDAGASCPAFGPSNDGQWRVRLQRDATHSVELPAFLVATTPPQTTIDSGPSGTTTGVSPSFAFSSDKPGTTFRCKLDGPGAATGTYAACSSPRNYTNLAEGSYTLSVYATDTAGNDDATPATRSFTVDTTLPVVTLTQPLDGSATTDTTPVLAGAAGNAPGDGADVTVNVYAGATASGSPVRTFTVARAGTAWSIVDSNWDAAVALRAPLADGVYTARAEQSDAGGPGQSNTRTFRVDTTAPATTDDVPTTTQPDDVTVTLTALDSGSGVFRTYYTSDDSDPADPANPSRRTYDGAAKPVLGDGQQIRYYSVDQAGNAEPVRTSRIVKVDRGSTMVEADGNQENGSGTSLTGPASSDWLGFWNSGRVATMVDPNALDDYFTGGTKEQSPLFWGFQNQAGGVTPAKSNVQAAWTSLESTRSTTFLYVAFKREGTTGNTFLTFELNQGTDSYVNSTGTTVPCRQNGDILVSFETGNPPTVTIYRWVSTAPGPPSCPQGAIGTFISSGPLTPAQFQGRMNTAPIVNHLDTGRLGTSFPTNSFGEAGIDLPAVLNQMTGTPCASFARVHVHSRSSEQISSQLQDNVGPYPLNVQSCAVTGTKFEDVDGDGVRDSGEPGIGGFRVYVDLDGDGSLDAGEPSDVSSASGAYEITGVPAGSYDVREALTPAQVAAGWTCSKPVGCRKAIEMTTGGNTTGVEFGNWRPATVSGTKFVDTNRNGFRDGAEGPLAGGTVYVDYNGNGTRDAGEPLAVTGADGRYTIGGIRPGSFTLRQEPLPGYVCTAPSPSCSFPPITFTSGGTVTEKDFADAPSGRVSGTKFEDRNADGDRDGGEPGLASWTVYVDYNGNGSLDAGEPSDVTDGAGDYSIDDVRAPGTHRVREVAQGGWTCSLPSPCSYSIAFVAGTDATGRDFGAWRPGSVSGTVWNDLDEGGTRGGGEPGLGGWTVFVDLDGNGVLDAGEPTAATAADGSYTIAGVRPGSYSVRQVAQGGWRCTAPAGCAHSAVTVDSGAASSGRDFGNAQSTTVSGTKWADHDRDGVQDSNEPGLSGWTVYVDYDGDDALGALEPSAVTDLNGDYTIARIAPNTAANPYAVRELPRANWVCTAPAGDCEWEGLVIAAGGAEVDRDFGAYRVQSVSGRTYEDRDANGAENGGDSARGGVTVWVESIADNGVIDAGEPSAVSDARGYYLIPDVPAGSFKVRQAAAAGWTCSVASADASGCFRSIMLAPGGTAPGNDFGAWRPASVSGTVFEDIDRDGARGVDEGVLAGATVVVETVTENGVADPGEPTATVGPDGSYSIGGLAPRTTPYRVVALPPAGHTCTAPAACAHSVALLSGDSAEGRDFGMVGEASVSGVQFDDLNADGVREGGEPGVGGRTVWVDYDNDGVRDAAEPSDVTDGSGAYSIDRVRLGGFRVRQEPATGWTCSAPAGCSHRVDFAAGTDTTDRDFGAWRPGSVSGTVFDDLDRGGDRDGGEPGLSGWTAFVDYDGDEVRDTDEPSAVSSGDGTYTIPGVRPGVWPVREELQGAYTCTVPVPCERSATVTSGGGSAGNDFGNAEPGVTLEGTVFHDRDADGAARELDPVTGEPVEPGLDGRTVWLETVAANGVADPGEPTTVTSALGDYTFRNLNPGSYTVRHDTGSAWNCSYPGGCEWGVSAAGGDSVVGQDFGDWTSPGISGRVYEDGNADGGWDAGEPYLNGWRVYLDMNDDGDFDAGSDPYAISATSGGDDGVYSIAGIVPDGKTHEVREEPPSGTWRCTEPANGSVATDCSRSFQNDSEATQAGDFGNYRPVTIAGVKYEDRDADGDRDTGEPGLGGRTIKLDPGTPADPSDDLSTTTAGDGTYSFPGLKPGTTYRVYDEGESGWTCSEPGSPCEYSVPTQSGDGTVERDFGAWRPVTIAGVKYEDRDADGDRDTGEPGLGGRTIKLDPGT
ncbi:MAG TPA: SdrD B-like domain-containing protein, partial [Thermoleophilaceae bacterium]